MLWRIIADTIIRHTGAGWNKLSFGAPTPGTSTGAGAYNPTKAVTELASGGKTGGTIIDEFQIYWVEWIDDETVAIGTNGVETLRVTKAMTEQNGGRWPVLLQYKQ